MTVKGANKLVTGNLTFVSQKVELENLTSIEFVLGHTDCKSMTELLSGINFSSQEEFDKLDVTILNEAIAKHSSFKNWIDFIQCAVNEAQL